MRKFITSILAWAGLTFAASAQYQIQNGNFEEWDNVGTDLEEPAHWNSFKTASGSFAGMGKKQVEKLDENAPGSNGSACVRIYSSSIIGIVAQGNMTTGQINMGSTNATDASGNYNKTNADDANFHQKFTGLPDAIQLYVQASCQYGAAVSCNLHTEGYFQDPAGNNVTAKVVAKADNSSIAASSSWELITIPFTYNLTDGTRPAYALVTLTTSGQPGKGNKNDYLKADDVHFLYYSEIASATFDGKDITFTDGKATVNAAYDASKLSLTSNGQGATIETQFDGDKTLTITVKGDNISEEPSNQHIYSITFDKNAEGGEGEGEGEDPAEPITTTDGESFFVPGGSFESWKDFCGSTYQTGVGLRQRPGTEPTNWNGSSINQKVSLFPSQKELIENIDGAEAGSHAVRMKNVFVGFGSLGSTAPGFITYGTPWVHAEMNIDNCAGGVYGGVEYNKRPDAIRGYFRRTTGSTGSEQAHVIAYLWSGTFKSTIGSVDGKTSEEAEDNDRAIMGLEEATGDGQLIASMDYTFETTENNEWEVITVPFRYKSDAVPQKMNIIISGADYWNRSNIKDGNMLDADNVQFIFFTDLSNATYDGEPISFEDDAAVLVGTYDENKLSLQPHGISASVEKSYNAGSRVLTITVKGGNYDADESNSRTYTVTFRKPSSELAAVTYNNQAVTINGNKASVDAKYDATLISITAADPAATVETAYDEEKAVLTITVKGVDVASDPTNIHTYAIQFKVDEPVDPVVNPEGGSITLEGTHTYTDNLDVAINGESSGGQQTDITVTFNNGILDLALNNFNLISGEDRLYVGNVHVTGVPYTIKDGVPYATFSKAVNVQITEGDPSIVDASGEPVMWTGPLLGEIPLTLQGKVCEDKLYCIIDIEMLGVGTIHVTFGSDSNWPEIGGGGNPDVNPEGGSITLEGTHTYTDNLDVAINGESSGGQQTDITVTFNNGTLDLALNNFNLISGEDRLYVGNVHVTGVPYTIKDGVPYATFSKAVNVQITEGDPSIVDASGEPVMWTGPLLGEIPLTLQGKVCEDKLYCIIDIEMLGVGTIHVTFGSDSNWPEIGGGGNPDDNPIIATRTYSGKLSVTVNGESSDDSIAEVECIANEDGTFNLELQDFILSVSGDNTPVGNIKLSNITSTEVPDLHYCMYMSSETIKITDGSSEALEPFGPGALWIGPYLGDIPATISGKISPSKLYMIISIYIDKKNILVTFGEDFTDAVTSPIQNAATGAVIYDMNGRARGTKLESLPRGIYIIGGKKVMR
ncbi:MAG: calycin-like domain-containing protein [Bacteroidaceae bacterium]|nr:calycin-like domain-containing protein [Bacteroidaceae bacterium]